MDLFLLMICALGGLGLLTICTFEPARRRLLESIAITMIFGVLFVVAAVIVLSARAIG